MARIGLTQWHFIESILFLQLIRGIALTLSRAEMARRWYSRRLKRDSIAWPATVTVEMTAKTTAIAL